MKQQRGFTLMEVLLAVAILAVLGAIVVKAVQGHQAKTSSTDAVKTSPSPSPIAIKPYIEIEQMGVKIPLEGLASVAYAYGKGGAGDAVEATVTFTSPSLKGCYQDSDLDGSFGTLIQSKDSPGDPQTPSRHIGEYYYFYAGPQSACVNADLTAKQQALAKALATNINAIEAQ